MIERFFADVPVPQELTAILINLVLAAVASYVLSKVYIH